MSTEETPTLKEAVETATALLETSEDERIEMLHRLRQSLRLSRTVRGLNRLLDQPAYRPLGHQALKSLGLDHGG